MKISLPSNAARLTSPASTLPRLLSVLLLLALASCGSGGPAGSLAQQGNGDANIGHGSDLERLKALTPQEAGPLVPVDAPAGISLPGLDELDRQASVNPGKRIYFGEEYNTDLPSANVLPANGLVMAPSGSSFADCAFCVFSFDLPDFEGPNSLETLWSVVPDAGQIYIGVSDYGSSRWSWFAGHPINKLVLPEDGEYKSPAGNIHVVMLLIGSKTCTLDLVRWGGNAVPVASLSAFPNLCDPNTDIIIDAGASSDEDPGSLIYSFDLDGNGSFEVENGDVPYCQTSQALPGIYTVGVQVTDSEGLTSTASTSFTIDSPGYDETEDNDSVAQANVLGPNVQGFEGSLGAGGFDGDEVDFYSISLNAAGRLHVKTTTVERAVFMSLYDATGAELLASARTYSGQTLLDYIAREAQEVILRVEVAAGDPACDYEIATYSLSGDQYYEIENNDTTADADRIFQDVTLPCIANLGADGYDGDSSDWFFLRTNESRVYFIVAFFDTAAVDIDIMLYNEELELVAQSVSVDSSEQLGFVSEGAQDYFLNCVIKEGSPPNMMGDYTIDVLDLGPPVNASLVVTPESGALPLLLTLDASATQAVGGETLVQYFWDINGSTGNYDLVTSASEDIVQVIIYAPGTYEAMLTAQQSNSSFGHAYDTYTVTGSVDEIEPNDTPEGSQVLLLPVSDFIGVLGPGTDNGGSEDFFLFSPEASGSVNVRLDYEIVLGPIGIGLFSSTGELLASDQVNDGVLELDVPVTGGESYILLALTSTSFVGTTGYSLDINMD